MSYTLNSDRKYLNVVDTFRYRKRASMAFLINLVDLARKALLMQAFAPDTDVPPFITTIERL
jgi:hypothetical protein